MFHSVLCLVSWSCHRNRPQKILLSVLLRSLSLYTASPMGGFYVLTGPPPLRKLHINTQLICYAILVGQLDFVIGFLVHRVSKMAYKRCS